MFQRPGKLAVLLGLALAGCAASGASSPAATPGAAADAAGQGGQAGAGSGGAGGTGAGGVMPPAGTGGAAPTTGGAGGAGSGSGGMAMGTPGTGGASPVVDAGPGDTGPSSRKLLVYTHSTGYRHASIEAVAEALRAALTAEGYTVEVSADAKRFTPAALAELRGVVMVSTTGKPLGDPGTEALAALDAFVKGGGALIGYHAASSTFYEPPAPYTNLWGGRFDSHPGNVRTATCYPEGSHPAAARLPASFPTKDEIYIFTGYRDDNQVVLRCGAFTGNTRLPIAWHRTEGAGRVFYSALGHHAEDFAPGSLLMKDHFLPGALWALGK